MQEKIFILFLPFIVLSSGQNCPGPDPEQPSVTSDCILVPGCNFPENGTLTPVATQCSNQLPDNDCMAIFPCPIGSTVLRNCDFVAVGTTDPASYPYVRSPACIRPNLRDVALKCKY